MALPEMIPVNSSQLSKIGYTETTKTLYVEFTNGAVYSYDNVEEETFNELRDAPSVGSFFIRKIKNGSYNFTKLKDGRKK